MGIQRLSLAAFALGGLLLTGCAGLELNPPKPAGMPRADAPVPLKVGVYMKKPRFEWQGIGGMNTAYMESHRDRWMFKPMLAASDDVGGKFLRALQAASAFSQVDEVKSIGFFGTDAKEHDLIIDADFSGKYTQDPAGMGKAMATGFLLLLPAPFIRYDDAFFTAAELTVYDSTGRLLHKYSERQDVATSATLFSAGTPGSISAGVDSAASNLAAKLVTAILADRAGYQRAISQPAARPRPVAAAPAPEPVSGPAAAPAPAPADPLEGVKANSDQAHADLAAEEAKNEPAPPSHVAAEPKPAPRGPLTPAEETAIDDQVMP
ncbi:MAG: hypothetical protein PHS14_03640 [Elusimicrobia bacterium]|nr:hypothetical protein [Elusimicrobiota bacterium]